MNDEPKSSRERQAARDAESVRIRAQAMRDEVPVVPPPAPPEDKKKQDAKNTAIGCLTVIVIVAVIAGIIAMLGGGDEETDPDTSPSADLARAAQDLQAFATTNYQPAEAAGNEVQAHAQKIANEESVDTVELARLSIRAAEAWEQVKFTMVDYEVPDELTEARDNLMLVASYREDAYRNLIEWVDTQRDSLIAEYQENLEKAHGAMLRGLAQIVDVGGIPSPVP